MNLLEDTGYSYSGIYDLLSNSPEKAKELLLEIDFGYEQAKAHQAKLEKDLEAVKMTRGLMISAFIHAHKSLKLSENEPLTFVRDEKLVVVKMIDIRESRIDYEVIPITIS